MTACKNSENLKHTKFDPSSKTWGPKNHDLSYGLFVAQSTLLYKNMVHQKSSVAIPTGWIVGYNIIPLTAFGHLKHKKVGYIESFASNCSALLG
jgi:hypothetical protein